MCAPDGCGEVVLAGGEDEGVGVGRNDARAQALEVGHQLRQRLAHEALHRALQPRAAERRGRAAHPPPQVGQQRVAEPAQHTPTKFPIVFASF